MISYWLLVASGWWRVVKPPFALLKNTLPREGVNHLGASIITSSATYPAASTGSAFVTGADSFGKETTSGSIVAF